MMNLILLAGPGSGKGTQAELLQMQFGMVHLSTGELFRENIKRKTELGKLAKTFIEKGQLVPDSTTIDMVRERLMQVDTERGVVFDGFPRTINQARALDEILQSRGTMIDAVIYLTVREDEIIKRLSGRLVCKDCQLPFHNEHNPFESCPYERCQGEYLYQRDDDKPETVKARLRVYQNQTAPLIAHYTARDMLIKIDGEGSVTEVSNLIQQALRKLIESQDIA